MRHAAILVEMEGSHKMLPLDEDEVRIPKRKNEIITFNCVFFITGRSKHHCII